METIKTIKSNKYNSGNSVIRLTKIREKQLANITGRVALDITDDYPRYYLRVWVGVTDHYVNVVEERTPFIRFWKTEKGAEKALSKIIGHEND